MTPQLVFPTLSRFCESERAQHKMLLMVAVPLLITLR